MDNNPNDEMQEWKLLQAATPAALAWKVNKMTLEGWYPQGSIACCKTNNAYGNAVMMYFQPIVRIVSRLKLEETVAWQEHSLPENERNID